MEHKGFTHDILFSTTQVDQVFSALASAQGEFEPLEKAHDGYRGKYADLSDIKKATKKALAKYNLLITHACDQSKIVSVLGHSSGQHITYITKFSNTAKDKFMQAGAWTFMRRYAVLAMLDLAGTDDPEMLGDQVMFVPDNGLGTEAQKILDDGVLIKSYDTFKTWREKSQFKINQIKKTDINDYKFIEDALDTHQEELERNKK